MKTLRPFLVLAALVLAGCSHHHATTFGLATFGNGERALWINWEPDVPDSAPTYVIPDEGVSAVGVSPEGEGPAWTLLWGGSSGRYELTLFGEDEPHTLEVLETVARLPGEEREAYMLGADAHGHDDGQEHGHEHEHGLRFAIKDSSSGGSDLLLRADGSFVLIPGDDAAFWDERLGGVPGRGSAR